MATTSKPQKVMIDSLGREVPLAYVSKYDKENDRLVRRIHKRQKEAREYLEKVMIDHLKDFDALRALRKSEKMRIEGAKGNISSRSFDGSVEVKCVCRSEINPDDRLNTAREEMEAWVSAQIEGANAKIAAVVVPLIQEAFRPSSTGGLSMARIASLLRINIKDPAWQAARVLMIESLQATRGKQYLEVLEQKDKNHPAKRIRVDLADCWPNEA